MERTLKQLHLTLPATYDDSLSYYEAICKLEKHLNSVIDEIEKLNQEAITEANAYTDSRIQELRTEMDNTIRQINALYNNLQVQYDNFIKDVNNRIVLINNRVDAMNEKVGSVLGQANAYTQQAIANNNEYIVDQTTKALTTVTVLNYFTGERVSIQDLFNYFAQFHLNNAITFQTMADRAKTYDELYAFNMTYTDLALNGGTLYR